MYNKHKNTNYEQRKRTNFCNYITTANNEAECLVYCELQHITKDKTYEHNWPLLKFDKVNF